MINQSYFFHLEKCTITRQKSFLLQIELNFIELTLESKKSVSFRHCKIGLSHYPVKIIEIEQNNWPQLLAGPRQLSYFVRCHMKNDVNIQSRADPDLNSNVTQLGRICCASKICQRNENAALKTFYVRNPSFIVTLYCRTLQQKHFLWVSPLGTK